jgi:tetratricopeptide (TPR) repeat protein
VELARPSVVRARNPTTSGAPRSGLGTSGPGRAVFAAGPRGALSLPKRVAAPVGPPRAAMLPRSSPTLISPSGARRWALVLLTFAACGTEPGLEAGDPVALAGVAEARAALELGDRPRALELLERTLERRPRSLEARRDHARLAASANRLEVALESYEAVLAAAPGDREAAQGLLEVALFVGRPDLVRDAAQALGDGGADPAALTLLSRVALERGDLGQARRHSQAALALAPGDAEALFRAAQVELESEQVAAATALLQRAVDADPGHAGAWQELGTQLLRSGAETEGRAAIDHAQSVRDIDSAGFAHAPAGERAERARSAAAAHPAWSGPWIELGRAELELERPDAALRALERALEARPRRARAARLAAVAARRLGDEATALAHQALAAELADGGRDDR